MKYQNQRPDLADQIKTLVQSANSVKTVPHGVKTVNPGEGLQLLSGDGAEIFWDWETAAEYDTRISEGRAAIEAAEQELAQTRLDLDAAGDRIGQAETQLTGADKRITAEETARAQAVTRLEGVDASLKAAQTTLEGKAAQAASDLAGLDSRLTTARGDLTAAQGEISTLKTSTAATSQKVTAVEGRLTTAEGELSATSGELATLQGTVGDVQAAVAESDRKAVAAQTTADQASTAAGNAASKATAAQTTADQAKAAAGTADEAARAASGLAATKGEIIYQASAPTGARAAAQNLWIRTTDNKPHTWNGTTWVAVTDKAATDAATAAASAQSAAGVAQSTADQAKSDAAAAAQSAVAAMTKAGQAQASADGKTTITATVNTPSGVGLAVGDLHMQLSSLGSGGQIIRQWRWNGSAWVDQKISGDFISNLDVGKLTGVFANISQHLQAGSIGADKVIIGQGENLIPDSAFLSDMTNTARTAGTGWSVQARAGDKVRVLTTNSTAQADVTLTSTPTDWIQVDPSGKYQLSMGVGGPNQVGVYLTMRLPDGSITTVGSEQRLQVQGALGTYRVEWDLAALGSPVAVRPVIRRYATPSGATNYYTQVSAVTMRRKVGTVLIEDGAITGDKVEAQTVAAKVGQFVKVQAANVEVTGDLSARVANFMDVASRNLIVTGDTTLAGSTWAKRLAAEVVTAAEINVQQLRTTGTAAINQAVIDKLWSDTFASHKVTTDELVVGSGSNLIPNGWAEKGTTGTGWDTFGATTATETVTGQPAPTVFWAKSTQSANVVFPVKAGAEHHFSVWVRSNVADSRFYVQLWHDTGASVYLVSNEVAPNGAWKEYTATYIPPAGVSRVTRIAVYAMHTSGTQSADGTQWFGAFTLAEKTGAVLIQDGAITTPKLKVTEDMSAQIVSAMSLTAKTGIFTDGLQATDATLLGTTVAKALVVEKLTGRDAILSGTVDVAQLNVTGAMSAEIVRTMDAQTKNLVVTEDAILNRATVVESLVTPKLIADKANVQTLAARMVSAGAIVAQDSTGSVQINPTGITVRDAAPGSTSYTRQVQIAPSGITGGTRTTPTVNIDGQNNWMIGEFSTAPDKQRVRIRSTSSVAAVDLFASNNTEDHVGIWYTSPDSNVLNAVGRVIAMTGVQHTDDSPGMLMWPMRGTFGFQGRWQQDSVATKFVALTNYAGLGPGAYNTITVSYQSAFRTNNSQRFPLVSVESSTGADVMATIVTQTATNITINVINQSGGKASGTIVLRILTFNLNA